MEITQPEPPTRRGASGTASSGKARDGLGAQASELWRLFRRNRLAVIVPKDNPAGIKELKDLAKSGLKIVLAAPSVPVGGGQ